MCGIAGYYKYKNRNPLEDNEILGKMIDSIKHRGPDDKGSYSDDYVELGFRRLSIIDIQGGHQPIFNENKSLVLVFNGEIYNYIELRGELIKKGHVFESNCDSEVIIHLYEQYGLDFVNRLDGMFAICLWNKKLNQLILARDRMGKKPLYYFHDQNGFVFGSEIKALFEHPSVSKNIDEESVALYMTLNYVPAPKTIYKNIFKLPAGSILVLEKGKLHLHSYWVLQDFFNTETIVNEKEMIETLRDKFFNAVKKRLMSDVPLGVLLSGGIDSSSIVAALAELGALDIPTFSVVFNKYPDYSEEKYSKMIAQHFNTNHTVLNVESGYLELIERVLYHMDEPVADRALIPTYLIFEKASQDVKVILSGEGADELFCGYNKYNYLRFLKYSGCFSPDLIETLVPGSRKIKKIASLFFSIDSIEKIVLWDRVFLKNEYSGLIKKQNFAEINLNEIFKPKKSYSFIEKMILWDLLNYLPENLLMKVDKLSMANGLEARVPYLDIELIKTVFSIPIGLKIEGGNKKVLQKKMFEGFLPQEILKREKHGFTFPVRDWIKHDTGSIVTKYLGKEKLSKSNFLNEKYVSNLVLEHRSGKQDHTRQIWNLITWQVWANQNGIQ